MSMNASHRILRAALFVLALAGGTEAVAQQRPAAPPPQQAQQPTAQTPPGTPLPPAVIAVVNTQRILAQAKAAVSIRNQIEQMRTQAQAQITRNEEGLRAEEQELARQRSVLAPQAFQDRERAFRTRVGQMQEQVQNLQRDLENAYNNAMVEVRQAMGPIFVEVTRTRGVNLILDNNQVVFGERSLEVTDEIIQRLDAALPTVRVQTPPGLGGGTAPAAQQQPRPPAQPPAQQPRR